MSHLPTRAVGVVACLAAVALGSCGEDKTPVAHVGDIAITRGDFKKELHSSEGDGFQSADRRFDLTRRVQAALSTLIHYSWAKAEARSRGITLTDADRAKVRKELAPDSHVPKWFIEAFGLDEKLQAQIHPAPVTSATVDAAMQKLLGIKAKRRDAFVVATRSKADAAQATRWLEAGVPFALVAQRYAGDWHALLGDKVPVGRLDNVTSDPRKDPGGRVVDPSLRDAIFKASFNDLNAPIKAGNGFYVIYLTGERHRLTQAEADAQRGALEQSLRQDARSKAYEEMLARHWLKKTICEKGYVVSPQVILLGGMADVYFSSAGCGNYVPFRTPAPSKG